MRILFPCLVIVLMLEGLVRKGYPEIGAQVLLVKDGFIICLAVFLLAFKRKALSGLLKSMNKYVLIGSALVLSLSVSSFLLLGIPLQMYLLGLREYFFYAAIMFASFAYFDVERATRFMKVLFVYAIVVDLAAICQATGVITSQLLLPLQNSLQSHSSMYGEFAYISSVFDVPERFAAFNLFIFLASYAWIRNRVVLMRWEVLMATFLLSIIALFISGRRVSFLLAVAFVVLDIVTERQSIRRRLAAFLAIVIAAIVGAAFSANFNSALVHVVFNTAILDEVVFYGKQVTLWYLDALRNAGWVTGYFGLTSPGTNSIVFSGENYFPDTLKLEGLWDKSLISMGILGSTVLLTVVFMLIMDLRRKSAARGNATMASIYYFVLCLSIWNIKSGEFMVWAPFSYLLIGLFYKLSSVSSSSDSGIKIMGSRRASFQNV